MFFPIANMKHLIHDGPSVGTYGRVMEGQLPQAATCVVIGGGIVGLSTAYHLAKSGRRDVVLIERNKLTSGTTWHSAAGVRQQRSTRNLTEIIRCSVELYKGLEAETGQATGWLQPGSLGIATTQERLVHLKRQASLARAFDIECEIVGPERIRDLWPLARHDDLVGGLWSPNDGRVNPSDICAALAKGIRAAGGRIYEDVRVTGFEATNGRVSRVVTNAGAIACESVALCTGLWGRELADLAGVPAPLYACEHFYLLTKPVAGVDRHLPMLGDHDSCLYVRDEVSGLLVGCFEPNPIPLPLENLPEEFAFGLLDERWEHFEPMMERAMHRIPALERAEVRMLLNGPESFTPDDRFLLGESPYLKNFFLGCGMNSVGVASGGGVGRALAEWMIEGRPTMDLWPVDIRRFAPFQNNLKALHERVPEILSLHYAISYPGRDPQSVRDLRRLPLHDVWRAGGASFTPVMGWERPNWFAPAGAEVTAELTFGPPGWLGAAAREHKAAREGVVLFDQSSFGKILVQGRDAEAFMQRVCANDMSAKPGRVVYSPMLNDRGGIESDVVVLCLAAGQYLLVTGTAQIVRDMAWLRDAIGADEFVSLTDVSSGFAILSVQGPRSRELLAKVSSSDLSNAAFPYYAWREIDIGYATVKAARISYMGELGWELYVPTEFARTVYDTLAEAGCDLGLTPCGMAAATSLRVEKAYRAWGRELSPDVTPFETGIDFAIKLDKVTPFTGQAALQRLRKEPLKRRIVVFRLDDPKAFPLGDEPMLFGGRYVGQLTSAAWGHGAGCALAMGLVSSGAQSVEAMVAAGGFQIEIASELFSAFASLEASYDPKGLRLRS